ncbi:MAG: hypothetical protein ACHQIM_06825 [Sphingobacteriales bacterium]
MTNVNSEKDLFLKISVALTGFNEAELEGTGMVDTYYQTILENNTADVITYFFRAVETIIEGSNSDEEKAIETLLMPAAAFNGLAQNIITMWYLGNWGQNVISGKAYTQGLVWDAAETHPPGAKQPGYGSWSIPPL